MLLQMRVLVLVNAYAYLLYEYVLFAYTIQELYTQIN